MFRTIRRKKNEISMEQGKTLLLTERRGVVAVNGDDGYPYAVPVNYIYDEENNKIYFHGARAGHKVDSIKACDKVCFTVYGNEMIKEEAWAPYMQSVVIFGRCHFIEDQEQAIRMVKKLAMKYYPSEDIADDIIERHGQAVLMFEIDIEHMTSKQVQEK